MYLLYESMWENLFDLETIDFNWEKICYSKIKQMCENNIAEFKYNIIYLFINLTLGNTAHQFTTIHTIHYNTNRLLGV